jgi:hypothetical protein
MQVMQVMQVEGFEVRGNPGSLCSRDGCRYVLTGTAKLQNRITAKPAQHIIDCLSPVIFNYLPV